MISSGTKRGLAAVAVSAMAVAGLPFLASSASAAGAPTASLLLSGPTRNGGALGGLQVLSVTNLPDGDGTPGPPLGAQRVKIIGSDLSTPAASVPGHPAITGSQFQGDPTTGNGIVGAYVSATTPTDGDTVKYALWVDTDNDGVVDGDEPRVQISTVLTGVPTSVDVTPASQTVTTNEFSGDYTGTLKDAAGRTTQLTTGETATIAAPGTTTIKTLDQPANPTTPSYTDQGTGPYAQAFNEVPLGTFAFKAADSGSDVTRTIPVNVTGGATKSVSLVVAKSASGLTEDDVDVVTGADTWDGFGGGTFGVPASLRVDQTAIKIDLADDNTTVPAPNGGSSVLLTFTGSGGVTFGGKATTTQLVTLDSLAKGTATANVDASSITENGVITVSSEALTGNIVLNYDRAAASGATTKSDAAAYVTKVGQPTTVVVTVKDQFGNPAAAPAQVSLTRTGRAANAGTTPRVTVGADGKATFTLPDAGTTVGTETFTINLYKDQFDAAPTTGITGGTINYNADGVGPAFSATAGTATIVPLTDGAANTGVDASTITIGGSTAGTPNAAATVTVDNGGLILDPSSDNLDKATASKSIQLNGAGGATFDVVGTKLGTATVTIVSGGVTKTVPVTIKQAAAGAPAIATARNVAIAGPAKATAGETAVFTATVTDAFGNPVAGVPVANLPLTVNGPANLQSSDAVTDAAGKLNYTVILTDNANSPVTARVTGLQNLASATPSPQFGAAADSAIGSSKTEPGLTASVATAAATVDDVVNTAALQKAVDDAQAAVDIAQNNLENAQGDKSVAQTEKKVAKSAKTKAKKALKQAKKHHKGVKAAQKDFDAAKGEFQIASAKVDAANKKVNNAKATLATAKQKLADAQAALEAAQSDS